MKKEKRQSFILSLIEEQPIGTQEQLVEALETAGYVVTQATVSRDIKALSLKKVPSENGSIYQSPLSQGDVNHKKVLPLEAIFKNSVIDVTGVDYFIVIHTLPGAASTVAFHLDQEKKQDILGTIAGDDTILVILNNKDRLVCLLEIFKGYL